MAKQKEEEQSSNIIKIPFGDKVITLNLNSISTQEIDVDEITKIQYHNVIGEILTISNLVNKVAILKAEQEEVVSLVKLDLNILESKLGEKAREDLSETDDKGKAKKPTIAEVDGYVNKSQIFIDGKKKLIQEEKFLGYVEALLYAVKDKSRKLETISSKIHPDEFSAEITEGVINGIMLKKHSPFKKEIKE